MKILVTGCAGFIGFFLTRKFLNEGHEVVGVDNINNYYSQSLKEDRLKQLGIYFDCSTGKYNCTNNKLTFIKSDVEDELLYSQQLANFQFDAICHLAAQAGVRYSITHPEAYINSNIFGFFRMLEYCRKNPVKKFIYASSSSVYGKNSSIPYREEDPTETPVSLYAATKKSNELLAHSYAELYGIHTIGLRFFTVYGPWGRPDMAPFIFTKAIIENQPIRIYNQGNMSRDFTYIDDIIEGIYKITTSDPLTSDPSQSFQIYNIGNSQPVNLRDFISQIEELTEKKAIKIYEPMQPGDVKDTWADTGKLQKDYNYKPQTLLRTGLSAFINWYKEYYK
ncbi:NAD-dependent epimerase/dehydratase family protein [Bacteroides sp. 224]|uniref:NAD-dependent epimerase/dehydratase family protein n=1 Tax=Bacteroides sp. 224 TaxID=2302936 RepID=UPI0013D3F344|nr:NAD-dependent epimerase/dehydratase family protein [Bacteroides sp. 224]NDV65850.1 NAD-dependent epimerase/dehydratase family protein [Bacteroides sp. 224]